jgi:hypothetical protein
MLLADLAYSTAAAYYEADPVPIWGGLLQAEPYEMPGQCVALLDNESEPEDWSRNIYHHLKHRAHRGWNHALTKLALQAIKRIPAEKTGLSRPKERPEAIEAVLDALDYLKAGVLIVDVISDVFGMLDPGSPDWVVEGLRPLVSGTKERGIITILSAHTSTMGKGERPLGTSQQEGTADVVLQAREREHIPGLALTLRKYRSHGRYWIQKGTTAKIAFGDQGGGYILDQDPGWSDTPQLPLDI